MSNDMEELKHDFSAPSGVVFKAILDKAKELGVSNRLSIHHMHEMSKAVIDTRPKEEGKVAEALEKGFNDLYINEPKNQKQETYNLGLCNMLRKCEDALKIPNPAIVDALETIQNVDDMVCKLPIRTVEYEKILTVLTKIRSTLKGSDV